MQKPKPKTKPRLAMRMSNMLNEGVVVVARFELQPHSVLSVCTGAVSRGFEVEIPVVGVVFEVVVEVFVEVEDTLSPYIFLFL